MPRYDYVCSTCGTVTEFVHGMHVGLADTDACACGSRHLQKQYTFPSVNIPGRDMHLQNGGRGAYIGQLAARPDIIEPDLYCTTQRQAIELAKRKTHGTAHIEK